MKSNKEVPTMKKIDIGNGAELIKAQKNVKMTGVEWRC